MLNIQVPLHVSQRDCVYYSIGDDTPVIIDAPHASGRPEVADERTGEIAEQVANMTGAGLVVSLIPRDEADLNRHCDFENYFSVMAHRQHRDSLYRIFGGKNLLNGYSHVSKPTLYISLHGMRGYSLPGKGAVDLEVGTRNGMLCDETTSSWIAYNLQHHLGKTVVIDNKFIGSSSLLTFIHGDGPSHRFEGYGVDLHVVQLELSRNLRFNNFQRTVDALINVVRLFRAYTCQIRHDIESTC